MTVSGPTKLIFIRAGKYDYGEVELSLPLHLVGPNNVGKTTLISSLQFLFIDEQRSMHFSREMDETRRYYFPDPNSYILFECLTPTGYQVVVVQGLGPVKRYEFRRFTYQGKFDINDFLDDERKIRSEDVIRTRLADRNYTTLEPKHLRAALTGIGDGKGINLGLVPIRNREHYDRFRRVFCNLLRLSHLSQDELKRFFYEIYEGDFQQKAIDLEQGYSSQYERVKSQVQEVRELRENADNIKQALSLAAGRSKFRGILPIIYSAVLNAYKQLKINIETERTDIARQVESLNSDDETFAEECKGLKSSIDADNQHLGVLNKYIDDLKLNTEKFKNYILDLERVRLANLQIESEKIALLLRDANREPTKRIKKRIVDHESELSRQETILKDIVESVALRLKTQVCDSDLENIFRLLNPELLGLSIGKEIEFLDENSLQIRIDTIVKRIRAGFYEDETVRVALSSLPSPGIGKYTDPSVIGERIEELKAAIMRDSEALKAAEEAEMLRKRKTELDGENEKIGEIESLQKLKYDFEKYQGSLSRAKDWQKERDDLVKQIKTNGDRLKELQERRVTIGNDKRILQDKLKAREERIGRLLQRIQALKPPDSKWLKFDGGVEIPSEIEDIISTYHDKQVEEQQISENLRIVLHAIDSSTYGRLRKENEDDTITVLSGELESLQKKEEAVERLWSGLAVGLRSAFKGLLKDLDTLKSKIDELNKQLAKISVSNLSRLRLEIMGNHQWIRQMKAVTEADELPLFSDPSETERAISTLGELLKSFRKVELIDLFELQFEVTTPDGKTRCYPKLAAIESNGTTITIKVLVNLMLLRGLLHERREVNIPFYLDEASSLDRDNLIAIVEQSRRMGFTPILASPEAMDVADHIYALKDRQGRSIIHPLIRINKNREIEEGPDVG